MRTVCMNVYSWSLIVASYDMWVFAVDKKSHSKVVKWAYNRSRNDSLRRYKNIGIIKNCIENVSLQQTNQPSETP